MALQNCTPAKIPGFKSSEIINCKEFVELFYKIDWYDHSKVILADTFLMPIGLQFMKDYLSIKIVFFNHFFNNYYI